MGTRRGAWRQHDGVSAGARGYDAAWQRLRLLVLAEEPLCRSCGASPATEADHIVPLSRASHLRLERTNVQGLCAPCHRAKTQRESRLPSRLRPAERHPGG